jgi:hypothetical protein
VIGFYCLLENYFWGMGRLIVFVDLIDVWDFRGFEINGGIVGCDNWVNYRV